jgi:hypothetical protein
MEASADMRRRDLFGAAAVAAAGCATLKSEPDASEIQARLALGLRKVGNPFGRIVAASHFTGEEQRFVESALRGLLLTAAIHEVPEAHRDAILLEQTKKQIPELDRALANAQAILQMEPADRVRIERKIRSDPSLPEKVTELLAHHARASGVPGAGRFELRSLAQQCAWRIQHQPISLVLDDTLAKMEKVRARFGDRAVEARGLVAQAQERAVMGDGYDEADELGEEKEDPKEDPQEEVEAPQVPARGKKLMLGGGVTAGAGLVFGGAGVGLFFAAFEVDSSLLAGVSVVMCGIGALALIVGLIVLIVGIVIRANDVAEYGGSSEAP